MKNVASKLIILSVAIATAIGGVLFFVRYIVNPPEDVSAVATAEHVFNPDIKDIVASYNPDTLSLKEAEVSYDALVDRSSIFSEDSLIIDKKIFDNAIAESSEKFTKCFISWSIEKFNKSTWNTGDHEVMLRLISKMRKVSIEEGSKKALSSETLSSLTEIESVINDFKKAWSVTKKTTFSDYQNVTSIRNEARTYANKKYLSNCTNLVNALNMIGEKQESSCYRQLTQSVNKLQYRFSFSSKEAYDNESSRVYDLIQKFEKTNAFGVSTAAHAKVLKDLQDSYDRAAENHDWPEI